MKGDIKRESFSFSRELLKNYQVRFNFEKQESNKYYLIKVLGRTLPLFDTWIFGSLLIYIGRNLKFPINALGWD